MIKYNDKLVLKKPVKKRDRVMKSGTEANFGPKIVTVPIKAGQLEGMGTGSCEYVCLVATCINTCTGRHHAPVHVQLNLERITVHYNMVLQYGTTNCSSIVANNS